jgi:hypothetical protein
MIKNKIIGVYLCFILLIFSLPAIESLYIEKPPFSLNVSIDVTGNIRTFHIVTYITNNGNEKESVKLICMPGGGFEIYNQDEVLVYNSPKMVWLIMWELLLEPGQAKEIFNETWKGINNYNQKLPSGKYFVRDVVFTDNGNIFSEQVDIFLEKTIDKNNLIFFQQFPILQRLILQ